MHPTAARLQTRLAAAGTPHDVFEVETEALMPRSPNARVLVVS